MEYKELMEILTPEREYAKANFVPIIRDKSSKFLYDFVKSNDIKSVLEIGTAIGYSGSIMLGAADIDLTTIDINKDYLGIAKNTFDKLGFSSSVDIYNDDAWNVINQLRSEGKRFDMIFLDGAKGQYVKYIDVLADLLNDNGVIFADNVLLQGMVESNEKIPHKKRTMVVNLRKYLEVVQADPYETEIVRIEDGIAITRIKRR